MATTNKIDEMELRYLILPCKKEKKYSEIDGFIKQIFKICFTHVAKLVPNDFGGIIKFNVDRTDNKRISAMRSFINLLYVNDLLYDDNNNLMIKIEDNCGDCTKSFIK